MDLLVAYEKDPAGINMARHLAGSATLDGGVYRGDNFDLAVTATPVIAADSIAATYPDYSSFVFLSKHAATSGVLALTCHSTGNFSQADFGGNPRQVAVPYPWLQKQYMQNLSDSRDRFAGFEITIEATHHGPSAPDKPSVFVEVGTTTREWNDAGLCAAVANILSDTLAMPRQEIPYAICMGGTHYSAKFTDILLHDTLGLGTVIPKHALEHVDGELFGHILDRNKGATTILLDWNGLGRHKKKAVDLAEGSGLEIRRL